MERVDLKIQPPSPDSRGFLKLMHRISNLLGEFESLKPNEDGTPKAVKSVVEVMAIFDHAAQVILPYVVEPSDRTMALEALEDCSQNQLMDALTLIMGGRPIEATASESPLVPPTNGTP